MATRRSHRAGQDTAERPAPDETLTTEDSATNEPQANGAAAPAQPAASPDGQQGSQPVMQRAEEAADRLGERVRHYASIIGFQILRFAARVKEEAEDIWAEAQSIRRGGQPPEA